MYDHSQRCRMLSLKTKPFPRASDAAGDDRGRPRPRRTWLSDHGDPVPADRLHAGDVQRDGQGALRHRPRPGDPLCARTLRPAGAAGGCGRDGPNSRAARAPTKSAGSRRRPRSTNCDAASRRIFPTRNSCCGRRCRAIRSTRSRPRVPRGGATTRTPGLSSSSCASSRGGLTCRASSSTSPASVSSSRARAQLRPGQWRAPRRDSRPPSPLRLTDPIDGAGATDGHSEFSDIAAEA